MPCPVCGELLGERTVRTRTSLLAAWWALAFGLAWWLTGDLLHDLVEGIDRSHLPLWQLAVPLVVLLGAIVATTLRLRRPACARCGAGRWLAPAAEGSGTTRRVVLRAVATTVAGGVGGVLAVLGRNKGWIPVAHDFFMTTVETTAPSVQPAWREARIQAHRRVGRTGVLVSDVSVGCGQLNDAGVARLAMERGVTYFDTSPDYADTHSERMLGEALRDHPRDQLFIATKFCRPEGHLKSDTPVPEIIASVEESLRRLNTDYVDLIHIHSCDRVERLMAPNIHEAFDRLKAAGKVRFLGVSTHTPNLEEVANTAIDSGRFDVMMLAYHFGMWPQFGHILAKAKAHDVGVVAMKTLKGAKHTNLADFRQESGSYAQAAFRWVLSNPDVSCLVVSFSKPEHVDEYLVSSGTALREGDVSLLQRYDQLVAGDYCQPHCGLCLSSCPEELPINDVLRWRMYARDYGWAGEGERHYAALDRDAAICVGCPAPCAGACPHGIPIRTTMLDAHRILRA